MDKYYYLTCILPFLVFGKVTRITKEEFLEDAKKWLSEKDFSILLQADINDYYVDGKYPEFLREYKEFEFNLRNELSLLRSSIKAGQKSTDSGFFASVLKEGNPLEQEKRLLHLRWSFLEDRETGHYFDLESIILYFLKLQILERLMAFNKDKGFEKFKELCEVDICL